MRFEFAHYGVVVWFVSRRPYLSDFARQGEVAIQLILWPACEACPRALARFLYAARAHRRSGRLYSSVATEGSSRRTLPPRSSRFVPRMTPPSHGERAPRGGKARADAPRARW